mmetsp:Transcript_21806/g.30107  ORF Transcript_21806/g.30107 Transcript_21806/m.30107 type:complete len:106 (-) Transcript_21806:135-452(-)
MSNTVLEEDKNNLQELSLSAGIDLIALRTKYNTIDNNRATQIYRESSTSTSSYTAPQSSTVLDSYHICKTCMGKGTIKVLYNKHMVVEKECSECLGESIVRTPDK